VIPRQVILRNPPSAARIFHGGSMEPVFRFTLSSRSLWVDSAGDGWRRYFGSMISPSGVTVTTSPSGMVTVSTMGFSS
jgi:hypothetical protein